VSALHLVRRFLGSLRPGGPSAGDEAWVTSVLNTGEHRLWARLSGADRRHAVAVARRVQASLGEGATRPVLAAALLHDVGKLASGLGTFGRVAATLVGAAAGRERAAAWSGGHGARGRIAIYFRHPELGGDLLEDAGSDALTVAWARQHHRPEARWTVPAPVGSALKAADDD
jgi:hypothetical protein